MHKDVPAARLSSFYFAYYAALGAFTPYWSVFLERRHQDAAAISVLMSLWYGTRIVAPSSWGWLVSRSTQPIRWLHIGCVLTLLSFLLFLLPMDFGGLFLSMIVFCFAYNAVMPQFEALTLSHLAGRSEHYGRIRVWGSIGFIGVVAVFGIVFDYVSVEHLPWLMLPLFVAICVSALFNHYGSGYATKAVTEGGSDTGELRRTLRRKDVIVFLLVALLTQISFGPLYTFFSLYLEQNHYRPSMLGFYWATGVTVEILVFFLSARIFARWDARTVLLIALASAVLRWTITALFPQEAWLITLSQLTHALNFAAFFAASMQYMARFFPGRLAGHGQGVYYGFSSGLGGVLGALIAGQAWRFGGGQLAFLIAAGFSAAAFALIWFALPTTRSLAMAARDAA